LGHRRAEATEGHIIFAGALALGLEGIVAKDVASPYVEGPRDTPYWLKIKDKNYERREKIDFHPRRTR
jgi:ATP-dependent DNA ligase